MITTYVKMRSELTIYVQNWQSVGYKVYRTRIECDCVASSNMRYGAIVIDETHEQVAAIVRCKGCFNALTEGGNK